MEDILLGAAGLGLLVLGGAAGSLVSLKFKKEELVVRVPVVKLPKEHVHEYDYAQADGKGLRCKWCWDRGIYTPHPRGKWQAQSK